MLTERGLQSSKVGMGVLENCARQQRAGFCTAGHGSRSAGNGLLNQLPGGVHGAALKQDGNSCLRNNRESGCWENVYRKEVVVMGGLESSACEQMRGRTRRFKGF